MSEHLETWIGARAFLSEESRWCKGTIALDGEGRRALFDDPNVKSTCIGGAVLRAAGDRERGLDACYALARICCIDVVGFPGHFNDTHTHAEVLAVFDRGIALGRASRTLPALLVVPATPARVKETV